jgi:hypothetical protein
MKTQLLTYWRTLRATLRRLPRVYRTALSEERARAFLLADLRRGFTPEQSFVLAMRGDGFEPGSEVYEGAKTMAQDLARGLGVGWSEEMSC